MCGGGGEGGEGWRYNNMRGISWVGGFDEVHFIITIKGASFNLSSSL